MKSNNAIIPLISLIAMAILAFVPLPHVIGMQIQGNLLFYIGEIVGIHDVNILNYCNLLFGIITLIMFYFIKRIGVKILIMSLTLFFLMSFLNIKYGDLMDLNMDLYFVLPMVLSSLITLPMLIIGLVLERIFN